MTGTWPHDRTRSSVLEWQSLFEALDGDADELAAQIAAAMRLELPTYRGIEDSRLGSSVLWQLRHVLAAARRSRSSVSEAELSELAAFGEDRAFHGIPVEDMLRGWRVAVQVLISRARQVGGPAGTSSESLLDFVESILAWTDAAMIVTARAHRDAELAVARREQERKAACIRGLLLGTGSPTQTGNWAAACGLDPRREHRAFRLRLPTPEQRPAFEHALGLTSGPRVGVGTLVEGDLAGLLTGAPPAEVRLTVGVGASLPLIQAAESFRLATRALVTAEGFGLSGIHDISSLGLRTAIAADADVGLALQDRYLAPLLDDPGGGELIRCLQAWSACGMHVDRTAERLFVHPNTVRARMARVETLTGARLREPRVGFELWWALEYLVVSTGEISTGGDENSDRAP